MKQKEMLILAAAAAAAFLIVRQSGGLKATTGTKGKYTAAANPYSAWNGYEWGTLDLPGYSLFDGAMDSLGLTSTNYDSGGLGLKDGDGYGLSYGGLTAGSIKLPSWSF